MTGIGTQGITRKHAAGETSQRSAFRFGLLALILGAAVGGPGMPVQAGVIGAPTVVQGGSPAQAVAPKTRSNLQLLKAQMHAFKEGLENLDQLKQFFEKDRPGREEIVRDAQQLIQSLPQTDKAGDAAWRIAAIASLATAAGQLSQLQISEDYNLSGGAIGWDFGAVGSPVQRGFTPVTPETLKLDGVEGNIVAVNGVTPLTDGINAPVGFKTSLPNGMYRILIVADPAAGEEASGNPFGNRITINGAPIGANDAAGTAPMTERVLGSDSGDQVAALDNTAIRRTANGLGIEGWVIVRDGRLDIDFQGLPGNRTISAIVAEPIDLDKMELTPTIADALATAFSGLDPAAGPETPRGGFAPRGSFSGGSQASPGASGTSGTTGGNSANTISHRNTAPAPAISKPAPTRRTPFINSFGNRRQQQVASTGTPTPVTPTASVVTPPVEQPPVTTESGEADDFFDRQILVNNKHGDENDSSQGVAKDLGNLLDIGSVTGTFLCGELPCDLANFIEITTEPDLSAASDLLGDWLSDPANVNSWDEIAAVLETWTPGSEIALIYEFDIAVELWTDVEFRANAGDGILVWIDGIFVYGATGNGTFNDDMGFDYRAELPNLTGGSHVLQIIVASHGGTTPTVNFQLRGNPASTTQADNTTAVPEPAAMALFGLGLAGLFVIRRRKARA